MNQSELFFLRSSEHYILDTIVKESSYHYDIEHYGYKNGDIGIYSIYKGDVEGAAWVRFNDKEQMPELCYVVKEESKFSQKALLEQLFVEVAHLYDTLFISVEKSSDIEFLKEMDFIEREGILILSLKKESKKSKDFAQDYDKYLTSSYF